MPTFKLILLFLSLLLLGGCFGYMLSRQKRQEHYSDQETVSVIIPTYNRYEMLLRAIRSVQRQTYPYVTEIIVIDDCSTDPKYSSGELEQLEKVTVIHLPINQRKLYNTLAAQGKTRQHGLNIAQGKWIAFLDDDDYWDSKKLEKQFEILRKHPEYKMCSTNMMRVDVNENRLGLYYEQDTLPRSLTLERILKQNFVNNSSVLILKNLCDRVGEFQIGNYEDWEYWLRALKYTNCYYLDLPLVYYTIDNKHSKEYELVR